MDNRKNVRSIVGAKKNCETCPMFGRCFAHEISDEDRAAISRNMKRHQPLKRADRLFNAGESAKTVTVLCSGAAKSYQLSASGDEVISRFHLPGDVIGLDAICDKLHPSFATALEDGRTCEIPLKDFVATLQTSKQLNAITLRIVSEELVATRELMLLNTRVDSRTRVAIFLAGMSTRMGRLTNDPSRFDLLMGRQDIGGYLGLSTETVSRALSCLQREGVITASGRSIRILNFQALEACAIPQSNTRSQAVG